MSNFIYPIQIDDSVYTKTIQDLDYNRVFNYLWSSTDWKDSLNKLRNNLKLGIENFELEKKVYNYSLLLRYFNNLLNYCRKASDEERENLYCDFIQCLEQNAICKSNPKIIRDLADFLCLPHTATVTSCCADYTYDIFTYDIVSYNSNGCTDFDDTITTNVSPVFIGTPTYIPITLENYDVCNLVQYRLVSASIASNSDDILYRFSPPTTPIESTKFILVVNGENTFGRDFTEVGATFDNTWTFNNSHRKEYLANYRKYLFRYINNEWYIDDVNENQYEQITFSGTNKFIGDSITPLHAGIEYTFNNYNVQIGVILTIDNPIYCKGLYLKVISTGSTPTLTILVNGINITVLNGETKEWYSDGTQWVILQ